MSTRSILTACALACSGLWGASLSFAATPAKVAAPTSAPASAPSAVAPSAAPATDELSLGSAKGYQQVKSIVVSFDANHLAFLGVKENAQSVVFDGKTGPSFEWVMPDSIQMTSGGRHVAYLVQTATQTMAVVDGKTEQGFFTIGHDRIFFSIDGTRHAYSAKLAQDGPSVIVVDGVVGGSYDTVDWPLFSADDKHVAYRGGAKGKQFMVLDDKALKSYDSVPDASQVFSPDGKRLAYEAITDGKHFVVLDEKESHPYDGLRLGPGFNTTGSALAAVVDLKGASRVLVNDQQSEAYDAMIAGCFTFSPDGHHLAYGARRGDKQIIVRDGTESTPVGSMGNNTLHFSPDSSRLVYQATIDGKHWIISDKTKFDAFEHILAGTPLFSPDSKRIAIVANEGTKWFLVIDGVAGETFEGISSERAQNLPPMDLPTFSPDSKRVAFRAIRNKEALAMLDDKPIAKFDAMGPMVFSPDSKHVVYLGRIGERTHVMIDGTDTGLHYDERLPTDRVVFDSNDTCHFIGLRNSEFFRVTVHVK